MVNFGEERFDSRVGHKKNMSVYFTDKQGKTRTYNYDDPHLLEIEADHDESVFYTQEAFNLDFGLGLLASLKKLRTLNLMGALLTSWELYKLGPVLLLHPRLHALNFSRNELCTSEFREIAPYIPQCPSLELLYLHMNVLDDGAMPDLCQIVRTSPSLKQVSLGGNRFSKEGVHQLANAWVTNHRLMYITGCGNLFWIAKAKLSVVTLSLALVDKRRTRTRKFLEKDGDHAISKRVLLLLLPPN